MHTPRQFSVVGRLHDRWLAFTDTRFFQFLRRHAPAANFLFFHCTRTTCPVTIPLTGTDVYIISSTLVGSLLIFAGGQNLSYVDSLFFAAGACTQAGLNPVDVNKLCTWQQVPIHFVCQTKLIGGVVYDILVGDIV
jgi:hypothetical protein